jgi:hypothetical protein
LPKLKQDQINHLNSPITPKEVEAVINSLPTKKSPEPDEFSEEFYETFKEDLIPILVKLFHKIETEGTLPNSLYEATVTLCIFPWRWNSFCLIRNLPVSLHRGLHKGFFSTSIMFNVPNRF